MASPSTLRCAATRETPPFCATPPCSPPFAALGAAFGATPCSPPFAALGAAFGATRGAAATALPSLDAAAGPPTRPNVPRPALLFAALALGWAAAASSFFFCSSQHALAQNTWGLPLILKTPPVIFLAQAA